MGQILVIDDEEAVRGILRRALERAGHEVLDADNTEEGIRCFHEHRVDLVIADLFMPKRGGLDLIRQLREDDPDVKIIAMTGAAVLRDVDIGSMAVESGARSIFRKPLDLDELEAAVSDLLAEAEVGE